MPISIVLVNAGDEHEAARIGRVLVESRLAASVNVAGGVDSLYRWQGEVCSRKEAHLVVKTRTDLVDAVIARVREVHSYECPAILALPVAGGDPDYLAWIERETRRA